MKILLVDDSKIFRQTLRIMLTRKNEYEVLEAGNSAQAYELVKTASPDVILLDILLPGESGVDILKVVKQLAPKTRVLMATAVNQDEINREVEQLGADGILYKPFSETDLHNALAAILPAAATR